MIEVLRRPVDSALTSPVRMENDTLLRCAVGERHFEGVFNQFGAHVVGQGPADDPTAGQVDDRGQVGPALPSLESSSRRNA